MNNYIKSRISLFFKRKNQIRLLKASELFDTNWYITKYEEQFDPKKCLPEYHYLTLGYKLGNDPSADFSTKLYIDKYPDVRDSGLNPLIHYLTHGQYEKRSLFSSRRLAESLGGVKSSSGTDCNSHMVLIQSIGLFQAKWYSETYFKSELSEEKCLENFLKTGYMQGYDPSPAFSCSSYFLKYPDILKLNLNPYVHYLEYGRFEGREIDVSKDFDNSNIQKMLERLSLSHKMTSLGIVLRDSQWFDQEWFKEKYDVSKLSVENLIKYYLVFGEVLKLDPHPFFSTELNKKVFSREIRGLVHPVEIVLGGTVEYDRIEISLLASATEIEKNFHSFRPDRQTLKKANLISNSKWFNRNWYRETYGLEQIAVESLGLHFCTVGVMNEYDPCPAFSTSFYLNNHQDVRINEKNALYHYIVAGRREGRQVSFSRFAKRMLGNERILYSEGFDNYPSRDFGVFDTSFDNKTLYGPELTYEVMSTSEYETTISQFSLSHSISAEKYVKDVKLIDSSSLRIFLHQNLMAQDSETYIRVHYLLSAENLVETAIYRKPRCMYVDVDFPSKYGSLIIEVVDGSEISFLTFPYISLLRGGEHFHELCFHCSLDSYLVSASEFGSTLYRLSKEIGNPETTELIINLEGFDVNNVLFDREYIDFIASFGIRYVYCASNKTSEHERVIYRDLNIQQETECAHNKYLLASYSFLAARLSIRSMIWLALGKSVDAEHFIYVQDIESSKTSLFSFANQKELVEKEYNPLFILTNDEVDVSVCNRLIPTLAVFDVPPCSIEDLAVVLFIDSQVSVSNIAAILEEFTFDYHLYLIILDAIPNSVLNEIFSFGKKVTLISCEEHELEDLSKVFENVLENRSLIVMDDISPFSRSYIDYMLITKTGASSLVIPQECSVQRKGKDIKNLPGMSALVNDLQSFESYSLSVNSKDKILYVDSANTKVALLDNHLLKTTTLNYFKYDKNNRRLCFDALSSKVEMFPMISVNTTSNNIDMNLNNSDQMWVRLN